MNMQNAFKCLVLHKNDHIKLPDRNVMHQLINLVLLFQLQLHGRLSKFGSFGKLKF